YGGLVAAPMVRSMLVQALALPDSPLDPGRVEQAAPSVVLAGPQLNSLPVKRVPLPAADSVRGPATTAVPELAGRRVRDGIHAAHQAGLRVKLVGSGRVVRTSPEAGDSLPRGSTITVYAEGTR